MHNDLPNIPKNITHFPHFLALASPSTCTTSSVRDQQCVFGLKKKKLILSFSFLMEDDDLMMKSQSLSATKFSNRIVQM